MATTAHADDRFPPYRYNGEGIGYVHIVPVEISSVYRIETIKVRGKLKLCLQLNQEKMAELEAHDPTLFSFTGSAERLGIKAIKNIPKCNFGINGVFAPHKSKTEGFTSWVADLHGKLDQIKAICGTIAPIAFLLIGPNGTEAKAKSDSQLLHYQGINMQYGEHYGAALKVSISPAFGKWLDENTVKEKLQKDITSLMRVIYKNLGGAARTEARDVLVGCGLSISAERFLMSVPGSAAGVFKDYESFPDPNLGYELSSMNMSEAAGQLTIIAALGYLARLARREFARQKGNS